MKNYFSSLILLLSTLVNAQTLSLDDAITKAIASHPDIQKFTFQTQKSKSSIGIAEADYLPQVTLNAEYDPTRTYVLPQNGVFNTIDDDGYSVGATLNQKIWDFGKTQSTIKAFESSEQIAKLSLIDAKALLSYKVKLQYELMFVQKEAIAVREKDLQAKKELYDQANAFVQLGMKTSADASRFLSSFYVAKDKLAIANATYNKARVTLINYIGEDIVVDVTLEDTLSSKELQIKSDLVYASVVSNSPQILTLQKTIQKDDLLYRANKSSHYGSLDALASYSYQKTLNEYDTTVVGVTLRVPLYSGGRTSALVEESLLEKHSAEATLSSQKLALKEEVDALIIDLLRYEQTIQAKNAQLTSSRDTKSVLEARYKEGLSTYIEVLDATALYLDAKLGLIEANYARSSIINRLEYLQGNI